MSDLAKLPIVNAIFPGIGTVADVLTPKIPPLPATPVVTPPPPMPLPDDKSQLMQQRKSLSQMVKARGRASTILTSDGTLGTPPQPLGG